VLRHVRGLGAKIANTQESGAEVVAPCSGCMVQIQGGLDKQAPGIKMKHIAIAELHFCIRISQFWPCRNYFYKE
jgi:hypothetical protein